MENCLYSKKEVCGILDISEFTLDTWYMWESKDLRNEEVEEHYLPVPIKEMNTKGRPRRWTLEMIADLKDFQDSIVRGRNGRYGKYTNSKWH